MVQTIDYQGKTDVGLKRQNNEDAFVIRPDLGFCAVADGMGGAAAGEVASRIFVETAVEVFSDANGPQALTERVERVFTLANARIMEHVEINPDDKGMGCTAEVLAFTDEGVVIGHIGDSRTYRMRGGEFKQLTQDHSLVQDQLNQGLITPEEARVHPMRNVILRAVGTREDLELDILKGKFLEGDIFLLCSDGLTDMVADETLAETLHAGGSLTILAEALIGLAKERGGKDNITVVLARVA